MSISIRVHAAPRGAQVSDVALGTIAGQRATAREEAAYAAGFECGRSENIQTGVAALEAALAALEDHSARAIQELEAYGIELAVEIARSLVRVRVDAGEYDLERVIRGALAYSGVDRGEVTLHLHPDDHAQLEQFLFRSGTNLEVDPSLPRGDVHLSTPRGLLVREVEGVLDSIREQLLEDLSS